MEKYEIFNSAEYDKAEKAEQAKEWLDKSLDNVDLDKIHSLVKSFAKSAGVEKVNLVYRSDVFTAYDDPEFDKDFAGTYSWSNFKVHINTEGFKKYPEPKQAYAFLHVFIHENVHAMEGKNCDGIEQGIVNHGFSKSVETIFDGSSRYLDLLNYFDEAVTEKIARNLVLQYIDSDKRREEFLVFANEPEKLPYNEYVDFLEEFVEKVSEKIGVSSEVAWEGIVSGYLNGENLFNPELEKAFEEVFYEGIMYEIGSVKDSKDLEVILQKMENGDEKGFLAKVIYKVKRKINGV